MNRREKFGNRLKEIRELHGITISELSQGTKLRENTIKALESGKFSADFDIMDKIAEFYNLEINLN